MAADFVSGAFIAWRCAGGGGMSGALGTHMRGITFPALCYFRGYRLSKSGVKVRIGIVSLAHPRLYHRVHDLCLDRVDVRHDDRIAIVG